MTTQLGRETTRNNQINPDRFSVSISNAGITSVSIRYIDDRKYAVRDFDCYNLFMRLMPIGSSILTDSKESLIQNAWYSRFCLRSGQNKESKQKKHDKRDKKMLMNVFSTHPLF